MYNEAQIKAMSSADLDIADLHEIEPSLERLIDSYAPERQVNALLHLFNESEGFKDVKESKRGSFPYLRILAKTHDLDLSLIELYESVMIEDALKDVHTSKVYRAVWDRDNNQLDEPNKYDVLVQYCKIAKLLHCGLAPHNFMDEVFMIRHDLDIPEWAVFKRPS